MGISRRELLMGSAAFTALSLARIEHGHAQEAPTYQPGDILRHGDPN